MDFINISFILLNLFKYNLFDFGYMKHIICFIDFIKISFILSILFKYYLFYRFYENIYNILLFTKYLFIYISFLQSYYQHWVQNSYGKAKSSIKHTFLAPFSILTQEICSIFRVDSEFHSPVAVGPLC